VDNEHVTFDDAVHITSQCMNYTNHTVLPEALETWCVEMFGRLLPRHLDIIYALNDRLMKLVRQRFPDHPEMCSSISIFEESMPKRIRMANLCIAFCNHVNGVAELHTEILKTKVFNDFYRLFPDKFLNITNGITPRRWLALCNPTLTSLISDYIGSDFISQLPLISAIRDFVDDPTFTARWRESKRANKVELVRYVEDKLGVELSEDALFDTQVKRIHEYKRQLMNIL
jgi:starch phosphorylase